MTELEQQLMDGLEKLSVEYKGDMERLEKQIQALSWRVSKLTTAYEDLSAILQEVSE